MRSADEALLSLQSINSLVGASVLVPKRTRAGPCVQGQRDPEVLTPLPHDPPRGHLFAPALLQMSRRFWWAEAEHPSALESLGRGGVPPPVSTLISLYTNWFEPRKDARLFLSAVTDG